MIENIEKKAERVRIEEQKKADELEKIRSRKRIKKIRKGEKYQNWLKKNGWTEETKTDFLIERAGNKVRLSKIIGFYEIK